MLKHNEARQRLARAIEDSTPEVLSEFINELMPSPTFTAGQCWNAQASALEYANRYYIAKEELPCPTGSL